jgi:hypothetical protein
MGGIWKSSVVPPERAEPIVVGAAALVALAFVAGVRFASAGVGRRTTVGVVVAGGVSLLVAVLPTVGLVERALGSLSSDWAALGILRDSHRYLAPLGIVLAVGAAALVDRLSLTARSGQAARRAIAGLLVVAPVLLLPSLVWGLAGEVRPVSYPADWTRVAHETTTLPGAIVALPWTGSYRGYGWNDHRAMLDPAARFLPGDVLVDDRVFLNDRVLPGEDPFLARVGSALQSDDAGDELRALGIRWVLVEKENGVSAGDVPVGTVTYDGRWLRLIDLGPPSRDLGHLREGPSAGIVLLGDIAAVLVVCVSISQLTRHRLPTHRYRRVRSVTRVLGRGRQGGSTS